ncbi:MAG: Fic family protein [Deltaproteobacteria bacterium]|nr:MAG: Fic family protein [Deltaproteobacteria bacterium]
MPSFHPDFLARLSFTTDQVAALSALGEARGRQELFVHQQPERLESLRQVAVVESTESSNRIEGITAPRHRIEALLLKPTAPRDRSEQEIAGYRDALALIHESHAHMPFSVNVLLQLHGMLYRYHHAAAGSGFAGRFKMTDNQIVEHRPDGSTRVRFQPTPAVQTPQAMAEFVEGYRLAAQPPALHPLVGVPLAILDFLCVHPFSDGNGRVARLATLLLLYQHGYTVGRYISLERIFEESKESYYETLERSSQGWHDDAHDPHPWLDYFWGAMQRAYSEFEDRVGVLSGGRGSKSELVRDAILRRIGPFAISDIERDCPGVSRELVRLVLRQMRDEGVLVLEGRGRGAKWKKIQE